jgi:hypothetical protein
VSDESGEEDEEDQGEKGVEGGDTTGEEKSAEVRDLANAKATENAGSLEEPIDAWEEVEWEAPFR